MATLTVRQLILSLLEDPLISIDQQIWVYDPTDDTKHYDLHVTDQIDPDPDGYRVLFVKEKK